MVAYQAVVDLDAEPLLEDEFELDDLDLEKSGCKWPNPR